MSFLQTRLRYEIKRKRREIKGRKTRERGGGGKRVK